MNQIDALKKLHGDSMRWSPDQEQALSDIDSFLISRETKHSLIGPAGTGKSTLMKQVIVNAKKKGWKIALTAPTHKAAKQLSEFCAMRAMTIHRRLSIKINENKKTGERELKKSGKPMLKNGMLLIVDEAGVLPEALLLHILKSANDLDIKILFVGDGAQLKPVGESVSMTVDHKMCEWGISELTTVHRQALENPIIALATAVRTSEKLCDLVVDTALNNSTGVEWLADSVEFAEQMINQCAANEKNRYLAYKNLNVDAAAKGIRQKKFGEMSIQNPYLAGEQLVVNERYVQIDRFDDETVVENNTEIKVERVVFDEGFYYMTAIDESALIEFKAFSNYRKRVQHLKGLAVEARSKKDWGPYWDASNTIADLRSASSLTVHKAQGSTFHNTFINLDLIRTSGLSEDDMRRLLYVALTRASNKVYLTGQL